MASPREVAVRDADVCKSCTTHDCIRGGPGGRGLRSVGRARRESSADWADGARAGPPRVRREADYDGGADGALTDAANWMTILSTEALEGNTGSRIILRY